MRIAIVVSDPLDWTAQALLPPFSKNGADSFFLDFSDLSASIGSGQSFRCARVDLLSLDALVVRDLGRRGPGDVAFRFEALQALQERGIAIINPPQAIARAANKFATSRALHDGGVATPKTVVTNSLREAKKALQEFKKAVSKPLFGYKGRDIALLEDGVQSDLVRLKGIMEASGLVYLHAEQNPLRLQARQRPRPSESGRPCRPAWCRSRCSQPSAFINAPVARPWGATLPCRGQLLYSKYSRK